MEEGFILGIGKEAAFHQYAGGRGFPYDEIIPRVGLAQGPVQGGAKGLDHLGGQGFARLAALHIEGHGAADRGIGKFIHVDAYHKIHSRLVHDGLAGGHIRLFIRAQGVGVAAGQDHLIAGGFQAGLYQLGNGQIESGFRDAGAGADGAAILAAVARVHHNGVAGDLAARFGGGQGGGDRQGGRSIKGPGGKGKANDQGQDKKGIRHMPEGRGCQPAQ